MTDRLKKMGLVIAALAAFALGGAGIAAATQGGSENGSGQESATESEHGSEAGEAEEQDGEEQDGEEAGDPAEEVSSADEAKAQTAAEKAVGGKADEVEQEVADGPEDSGESSGDPAPPAGSAYKVEVTNGSKQFDVYLDDSFGVLDSRVDQAD